MNKKSLISLLVETGICRLEDVKGCSLDEIESLEKSSGVHLPTVYKEFLSGIGKGAGEFFQGTDIFFYAINGLKEEAINLLNENDECFVLPSDAFVFLMHQGYEFCYFNSSEGADPPVYQYIEGNGSPVLTWSSFSQFMKSSISHHR